MSDIFIDSLLAVSVVEGDLKAFPGPRGPPDPPHETQKIRPDCLQVPRFTPTTIFL